MATKRTPEARPYVSLAVLTDAETGRQVCVSGMWLTSVEDAERGTVLHLLNGQLICVEESLMRVAEAFTGGGLP